MVDCVRLLGYRHRERTAGHVDVPGEHDARILPVRRQVHLGLRNSVAVDW